MINLMLGDCLIESDKIESGSVDLILTDLPYGTVKGLADSDTISHGMKGKTEWDTVIDTDKIMDIANRILRKNGKMILFAQHPFTYELISKAIPNLPFNYSMIWEKDHFANPLAAKKAPVNYFEDILVFSKTEDKGRNHPLINYSKDLISYIGLTKKQIAFEIGLGDIRFLRVDQDEFAAPTAAAYMRFISMFNVEQMEGFKSFKEIKRIDNEFKKTFSSTFNLWEGNKFKSNILKYKKDYDGYHPTQKPVLLLEDLIRTYSNEGDLVADLTMGSGSTGAACVNAKRKFIGIEMDEAYFNIAKERIGNA